MNRLSRYEPDLPEARCLFNRPGPRLNIKTVFFPSMGISMLKIRRSRDCHIFNMGVPILVRRHLYIETAPRLALSVSAKFRILRSHSILVNRATCLISKDCFAGESMWGLCYQQTNHGFSDIFLWELGTKHAISKHMITRKHFESLKLITCSPMGCMFGKR